MSWSWGALIVLVGAMQAGVAVAADLVMVLLFAGYLAGMRRESSPPAR